jgi:hypothetical protein
MKYAGLLVLCSMLVSGCLKSDITGNNDPVPVLVNLVVQPDYGENGRTFVYWSHKDGSNAVLGQPGVVRFTVRNANGVRQNIDVIQPFDSRVVENDLVELEYRQGRDVQELIIQQQDVHGRIVSYECFGPIFDCFRE